MRIIFRKQKLILEVLLSTCLIFCQFQPGVAYKSVAYIKSMYSSSVSFIQGRNACHFSIIWKHYYDGCFWLRHSFCVISFYGFDNFMSNKGLKNYFYRFFIAISNSAKLSTLSAHMPTRLVCLCAHVPTYLEGWRANVPRCILCLRAFRNYMPPCLAYLRAKVPVCLRAHVSMCLACLRTHVPTGLACLHAHVPASLRALVVTCLTCPRAHVSMCLACLSAEAL